MKKLLSVVLAVMMLLGCMSVTAFAEEPDNTTDITLTVAKSLTYDMVIPKDVTNLNAAGIYSVGQAKATNVKNATDKTVISYTAATTAFTSEGKAAIPATYYTDAQGTTAFPTTAVEVYKNKADAASIPTMYVGISETDWNAAENGTYTATVTFNFSTKEVTPVTAADALVPDAMYELKLQYCPEGQEPERDCFTYKRTTDGFEVEKTLFNDNDWTETYGAYCTSTAEETNIIFNFGPLATFTLNTSTNTYCMTGERAPYTEFISFSVKPAGATEFTEVTLTEAVTAADALAVGAEFTVNSKLYSNHISVTMKRTAEGFSCESAKYNGNDSSTLRNSATASVDGTVITFHYVYGSYTVDMTINTASNAYTRTDSATVITYESFAIKPAGATEFTEITLTIAE